MVGLNVKFCVLDTEKARPCMKSRILTYSSSNPSGRLGFMPEIERKNSVIAEIYTWCAKSRICGEETSDRKFHTESVFVPVTGSPLVIGVEDTEDSKPKDGRR